MRREQQVLARAPKRVRYAAGTYTVQNGRVCTRLASRTAGLAGGGNTEPLSQGCPPRTESGTCVSVAVRL